MKRNLCSKKQSQQFAYLFSLVTAFFLSACSSTKNDPAALSQVGSVAVVGFELVQEVPKDFSLLSISVGGGAEDTAPQMGTPVRYAAEHPKKITEVAAKALSSKVPKVISMRRLGKNGHYRAVEKEEMSGFRSLPPPGKGRVVYIAPQTLDYWSVYRMDDNEKSELSKKLGVDAIAFLQSRAELKQKLSYLNLVGGGRYTPEVSTSLHIFSGKHGKEIWRSQAKAKADGDGVKHWAGISKEKALNKLVVASAKKSIEEIVSRMQ